MVCDVPETPFTVMMACAWVAAVFTVIEVCRYSMDAV